MTVTWLAVEPLDTVMVRDGRTFTAGAASRAVGTPPPPSTIGGVLRSAVGRDVERILGPVVTTEKGVPVFPVPQDIVRDGSVVRRLDLTPREPGEVSDVDPDEESAAAGGLRLSHGLVGEGTPEPSWITKRGLGDWLRAEGSLAPGQRVEMRWARGQLVRDPAWLPERRLGLARHWDGEGLGTARPGMLYTMAHLRPRDGVRLLVACVDTSPVEVEQDVVGLGGRGRLARVSVADDLTSEGVFPAAPTGFPGGRVAVYVATPALLGTVLWHPPGARLCAVAVSGPQPIATASQRDPKRFGESRQLAWAVPAGSVFYLTFDIAEDAQRWAQRYHGELLPGAADLRIVTAGFGTCLMGRW